MKRKNTARNALVTSIISLLLCVSMLVGATFAWFTDEVTTGMNTIAAGNLDIELLADGTKVDSTTPLFDEIELWEPGVVAYENLQVANVGTLALKYQMSLNFGNENDLNGHKLSEVLKVAVIDKVADDATREEVLALAQAAVAADQGKGALSNFYLTGELLPGESGSEQTIVIFWAPNDNATDNLYNANNGQVTSDGEPLSIEFGINLQATQKMYEEDSFGPDYDENASILPKASVNGLPAQTISTTWGMGGGAPEVIEVPFILQFQPNEQLTDPDGVADSGDEYLASEYAKWHADFVVSADHDVPANSMALGGYYKLFCDGYNGGNWVSLTSSDSIPAGTQVRLVDGMGSGAISVNYEEICRYGNDGTGFLCTAKDLTGVNAGTTITVELRLYETYPEGQCPEDHGGHMSANCETGYYEVAGVYTYTFPGVAEYVEDAAEFADVLASAEPGSSIFLAPEVDYGTIDISSELTDVTIVGNGEDSAIINIAEDAVLENVTFKGFDLSGYNGPSQYAGAFNVNAGAEADITFEDCSFAPNSGYAGVRVYEPTAELSFVNCTFNGGRYGVYDSGSPIAKAEFIGCKFIGQSSWAIQFNGSGTSSVITIDNCTFDGINGGIIKVLGAPAEGSTFTFTNNTITAGKGHDGKEAEWFWISSAYTSTVSGNTRDGAAWAIDSSLGLGR